MTAIQNLLSNLWPGGRGRWAVVFVVAAYFFVLEPVFLHSSRVPDELWYLQLAQEKLPNQTVGELFGAIMSETNRLGYGALYWNLYSSMVFLDGKDALFGMRLMCLCMMAFVGWLISVAGVRRQSSFAELAAFLWFTLPVAWWSGKVTGPEVLSVVLAVAGAAILSGASNYRWDATAFGFIGLSIGVKFNAAPIAIFAFILWRPHTVKAAAGALAALAAGFAAANPFVLWNPGGYLAAVASMSQPPKLTWAFVGEIFSNSNWEWDGVLSGGLLQWSLPFLG